MRSRISFFDKNVFRKDLVRFAPAWGLYTLCMLIGLFLMMDDGVDSLYWLGSNMVSSVDIMCVFTPCYALLTAQLLFGDLYSSRMCNALHAFPLRRETWYFTHVASGLVFHLIPTVAMAAVAVPVLAAAGFPGAWVTGFGWLLGVNLQYMCFFGIAVFSALCVGNRFAMALVYGILNFAALIVAWLIAELYVPMYYGVRMDYSGISAFSPVYRMASENFLTVRRINYEVYGEATEGLILLGENWGYYWIYAAAGGVLLLGSVQLYRKRHLECAGDFLAIKGLESVFHGVYSVAVGAAVSFIVGDFFGLSNSKLILFIGMAVGYFTGRMLLERDIKVFRFREFVRCGVLLAGFGVSLLLVAMDPFGIVDWMPQAQDVKSVRIATGHYTYHECERTLTEPQDIETVLALHADALERNGITALSAVGQETETTEIVITETSDMPLETAEEEYSRSVSITITYELENGRTVSRYYEYWSAEPEGEILNGYFSAAECLFWEGVTAQALLEQRPVVDFSPNIGNKLTFAEPETVRSFYEAILKDCEAGTMAQSWGFHDSGRAEVVGWIYLRGGNMDREISIFSDAQNTVQWLKENGYDWNEIYEKFYAE